MWSSSGACNCNKTRKSMEEVWKDISFASLQDHTTTAAAAAANNRQPSSRGIIFQDFLGRPFNKEPPRPPATRGGGSSTEPSSVDDGSLFGSPPTVSSLNNSGPDFQYLESTDIPLRPNPELYSTHDHHSAISSINSSPFDALATSSSSLFSSFSKKRGPEKDDYSRDRLHKRMMKNRESAARSRARKQAYTNELELEITHLMEENDRLRRQQDKFLAKQSQLSKKFTLSRASTAPF